MSLKASIDIGTNSTRLLVVEVAPHDQLSPLLHRERLTKLGTGLNRENELSREAMLRVIEALQEYRRIIEKESIKDVRVFATSATRDARNREEFLSQITTQTGFNCRVLSGEEEARLSFLGVTSDLAIEKQILVCDVGGGSTEFISTQGAMILSSQSLNIGSGRLTRQFLLDEKIDDEILNKASGVVAEHLKSVNSKPSQIVGVGGTAAALALMDSNTPYKSPKAAHHYRFKKDRLEKIVHSLATSSLVERQKIIGLHPERADVMLGGALIYLEILKYFTIDSVITSLRDLMFGIFLE
jgi:exopolyphosphatase/guanosine-5'-triphosphate,3'-diphosphate pyrophosphatase